MGKRSRRRGSEEISAPASEYRDSEGNVLVLRGALSPATRRQYSEVAAGSPLSREDAWQRSVEFLFERLAVSWQIAGTDPISKPKELLGRFRMASQEERRFVRESLRTHTASHFPELHVP